MGNTTPPDTSPRLSPARGHGRGMTYGTFANTYLVGRRPSRSSPHRRSRSVRSAGTGYPAHGKGTYSTYGTLCALLFGPPSSKTSRPRDQLRLRSQKTSHPPRQDAQINYLDILAIFVKQRTYLATLLFIWPSCPYLAILPSLGHLARSLRRIREIPKRRNVTSSVRRRFAQGGLS